VSAQGVGVFQLQPLEGSARLAAGVLVRIVEDEDEARAQALELLADVGLEPLDDRHH
jgi:hypothetical protein